MRRPRLTRLVIVCTFSGLFSVSVGCAINVKAEEDLSRDALEALAKQAKVSFPVGAKLVRAVTFDQTKEGKHQWFIIVSATPIAFPGRQKSELPAEVNHELIQLHLPATRIGAAKQLGIPWFEWSASKSRWGATSLDTETGIYSMIEEFKR